MIELKITGTTIADFYSQLAGFFLTMAQGANSQTQPVLVQEVSPGVVAERSPEDHPEAAGDAAAKETKPRRGRPPKLTQPAPEPAAPETKAEPATDADPLLEAELAGTVGAELPPTKDDVIARVKAIIEAHAARGNARDVCVDYVRKLFANFEGVKKVIDLKEDQYADFMAKSEAFLAGEA